MTLQGDNAVIVFCLFAPIKEICRDEMILLKFASLDRLQATND